MKNSKSIDIARVIFACLIPLFHIQFSLDIVDFISQYVSRLGVPFFFCVSGLFLIPKVNENRTKALKKYFSRISLLLIVWLGVYAMPLLLTNQSVRTMPFRTILFATPAYLWYLSALLFASVPFCLIKNRKLLLLIAIVLYIIGTALGDSYSWLFKDLQILRIYKSIFITTRNGAFFALLFMCIGEWIQRGAFKLGKKLHLVSLMISYIVLAIEISFVRSKAAEHADLSMYFMLPICIALLTSMLYRVKSVNKDTRILRLISSAIYLMQYGIIFVMTVIINRMPWLNTNTCLAGGGTYLMVVLLPVIFVMVIKNSKISRYIF